MAYYPVNLDIRNRPCLVVGGGVVASRKVKTLVECGAVVTVVSLEFTEALERRAETSGVTLVRRAYRSDDLDGRFLVIGATDDEVLNRRVHADAEARCVLCNIADAPAICNFILPSVVRRGDLIIAVSTSGKSPAFAKKLRKDLESQFGEEYGRFLTLMGAIRKRLLAAHHAPEAHKPLFETLIGQNLLELIKTNQTEAINRLLFQALGEGFDYEDLIRA